MGPFPGTEGFAEAANRDRQDRLSGFKDRFVFTDPEVIYLDGNSLGRQPVESRTLLDDVINRQWGGRLIRSWNEGWWDLQLELGDRLSPLVGANPGEVIISDSTSVNLYKLAEAAVNHLPKRSKIVTDDLNFPTDVYVLEGIARAHGLELVIVKSDGIEGPVDALSAAIDDDTALVSLSHTVFKSGYTYDMAAINEMVHRVGALILWDTSHSVGAVPFNFESTGTDLAIGCTYKYLNGGPGSPAFLYVRNPLQAELQNPITAWWAHAQPFDFELAFEPTNGIRKFHTGTMPMLSLAAVGPGIDTVADAGMAAIRDKSVGLTEFFIEQSRTHLESLDFELASPADSEFRGSHVSLAHDESWQIVRALIELGNVLPDFRSPDNLRFGLAPLYTSFVDVHTAIQRLRVIVERGAHKSMDAGRLAVT